MTRSSQVTYALSAMKNERATGVRPEQASIKFVIFEDNVGGYCWTLVAASGERLAQSTRSCLLPRRHTSRTHRTRRRGLGIDRRPRPRRDRGPVGLTADRDRPRLTFSRTDQDHRLKPGEISMDSKHVDQRNGRLKKTAGSQTGDKHLKNAGHCDHAKDSAKNAVDKVVDTLPGRGTE